MSFFEFIYEAKLQIYSTSLDEEGGVPGLASVKKLDFDDALQYFVAKKFNTVLVSFDKDFDHTDVKRLTPGEALSWYAKS